MNEKEALEYAVKILEAESLMHYGARMYPEARAVLEAAASNPDYREMLEEGEE